MARFLKLAAVGGEPLQLSGESGGIFPGEFVCSWLQNKLDLILCDHPQLIVLDVYKRQAKRRSAPKLLSQSRFLRASSQGNRPN